MPKRLRSHKYLPQLLIVTFLIIGTMLFLKQHSFLAQWENLLTDALYVQSAQPKQVSVVGIDEASLAKYGAWPWDRKLLAQIVQKLSDDGVRVAAFDITLFEARDGDTELAQALKDAKMQVVLAGKIEGTDYLSPEPALAAGPNIHSGYVNLFEDDDHKIRSTVLTKQLTNGNHPSFAYRALLSYFGINGEVDYAHAKASLGFTQLPGDDLIVNFVGGKSSIKTISVKDVLEDTIPVGSLKDQLVFVGSTVQDLKFGLDDNLITPAGLMPGVEIHANVASTVINNRIVWPVSQSSQAAILLVLAIVAVLLTVLTPLGVSTTTIIVGIFVYMVAMIVTFEGGSKGDFLYTPLTLFLLAIVGMGWRYFGKIVENLGLKRAFSQYVNEQLLGEIMRDPSKLKLGGERRNMSVFFSDIRGFTTISEKLDAEKLVEFLNVYLTKATDKILQNRGVVDKYLGDAIMALWNAPLTDPHHALNACYSGLDILDVLADFNASSELDIPKLQIGIGINTGDMVVGNMGSVRRFDYTVMGDNVNLASRLEGLTKKYHCAIILGEGVVKELEQTGDNVHLLYRQIDVVTVKGKEKPVKLYQLLGHANIANEAEVQAMSQASEAAMHEYIAGHFVEAEKQYLEAAKQFSDEVSQAMAERCADLAKTAEGWKGYWAWDSK